MNRKSQEFQKWSLDDLWTAYYEHYFYDHPENVELIGYEENTSDNGVKYYKFEGDELLSKCEQLIGEGKDEEAYELLNQDVDFDWEKTFDDDIIKQKKKEAEIPPESNFLDQMGVVKHG